MRAQIMFCFKIVNIRNETLKIEYCLKINNTTRESKWNGSGTTTDSTARKTQPSNRILKKYLVQIVTCRFLFNSTTIFILFYCVIF